MPVRTGMLTTLLQALLRLLAEPMRTRFSADERQAKWRSIPASKAEISNGAPIINSLPVIKRAVTHFPSASA